MVLVISGAEDTHARKVLDDLKERKVEAHLLDFHKFPTQTEIAMTDSGKTAGLSLVLEGRRISMCDVDSILYRRPQSPRADDALKPEVKEYVVRESNMLVDGISNVSSALWVSDPDAVHIASRKPYQLRVASALGFRVPRYCIGNSPSVAEAFLDSLPPDCPVAVKPLNKPFVRVHESGRPTAFFTQRLEREAVRERLGRIKNCPLILEEYVEKKVELRITVVGSKIFTCAIHSQLNEKTKVDWRRYDIPNTPHKVYELPAEVESKCVELLKRLSLQFGALDMIVTPDGEYVFLEINPAGQWLWIEELTKLPITDALVDLLMGKT